MIQIPQNQITVRFAETGDAKTIADFNIAMAWETETIRLDSSVVLRGVEAIFEYPNHGFYVVAIIEGRIVGCLMITYEWSDWRNGVQWWLQSVYVDSEYRRIGVFNRLYAFVKKQALSKKDVTGIRLYVDKSNQKAMTTYKSLGMQPTNYLIYETSVQNT